MTVQIRPHDSIAATGFIIACRSDLSRPPSSPLGWVAGCFAPGLPMPTPLPVPASSSCTVSSRSRITAYQAGEIAAGETVTMAPPIEFFLVGGEYQRGGEICTTMIRRRPCRFLSILRRAGMPHPHRATCRSRDADIQGQMLFYERHCKAQSRHWACRRSRSGLPPMSTRLEGSGQQGAPQSRPQRFLSFHRWRRRQKRRARPEGDGADDDGGYIRRLRQTSPERPSGVRAPSLCRPPRRVVVAQSQVIADFYRGFSP